MKEIMIDGIKYVPENSLVSEKAKEFEGMKYCVVRTYSAGVFAGYIENRIGKEVVIRNVKRIWYWSGANSLSQLAKDGTSKPNDCKFSVVNDKIEVMEAIEIIECTEKSRLSIESVKEWKI